MIGIRIPGWHRKIAQEWRARVTVITVATMVSTVMPPTTLIGAVMGNTKVRVGASRFFMVRTVFCARHAIYAARYNSAGKANSAEAVLLCD
jgi:hypothetical protein